MNYELGKQLKEARFIQGEWMERYCLHGLGSDICSKCEEFVAYPSLRDLIKECGPGDMFGLVKFSGEPWRAFRDGVSARGDTDEEAVANLWLELRTIKN